MSELPLRMFCDDLLSSLAQVFYNKIGHRLPRDATGEQKLGFEFRSNPSLQSFFPLVTVLLSSRHSKIVRHIAVRIKCNLF